MQDSVLYTVLLPEVHVGGSYWGRDGNIIVFCGKGARRGGGIQDKDLSISMGGWRRVNFLLLCTFFGGGRGRVLGQCTK